MKRIVTLALAVLLVASMTTVAFAAESTTTLTTTVPAATYTLNIPANQDVPFGSMSTELGIFGVSESAGFAVGKNLQVTLAYEAFKCDATSTEIPYSISLHRNVISQEDTLIHDLPSGNAVTFLGRNDGTVGENIYLDAPAIKLTDTLWLKANSEDWGKALAGEYTSTITFTAEVVVEE